jgi:hypothetical protein
MQWRGRIIRGTGGRERKYWGFTDQVDRMDQTTLYFVLGGLLVLVLVLASIAQRYHDYVEERRTRIQRILARVDELDGMLLRMAGLPLPEGIEGLIRQDMLERLMAAKQIHGGYPGVSRRIQETRNALNEIQKRPASFDLDALRLEQFSRLTSELLWILQERRLMVPIPEDQRIRWLAALNLGRADAMTRYHLREAERLEQGGQLHQAQWHCQQLRRILEPLIPTHQQVEEWLQSNQVLSQRIKSQLQDEPSSVDGSDTSSSNGSEIR